MTTRLDRESAAGGTRLGDRLRALTAPDRARFFLFALAASAVVALLAAAAGVARVLPILLDPEVPRRAARPFLLGVLSLSCEVGLLVGWPLGWAEAAVRSRERGEARARMALGESPLARVLSLWPAIVFLGCVVAIASIAWGRDARAPGRVARALVEEARVACAAKTSPDVAAVPLVRATWLCRPGRAPLLLGEGAGSAHAIDFVASSLGIADDLTAIDARDVQVLLPTSTPVRMRVGDARVKGLAPFSAPSAVSPIARALVIVASALFSAVLAATAALGRGEGSLTAGWQRAIAWGIAIAGPATTLAVLRACERSSIADARLLLVPLSAAAATFAAQALVRAAILLARRRARYASTQ